MLKVTQKILLLLGFVIVSCNMNARNPLPDNTKRFNKINLDITDTTSDAYKSVVYSIDTFYKSQAKAGFNGSVLIGYKGRILYENYFGVSQKESGAKWDTNTQSQLASTSKTLTAGAIMLLKEKGLLEFDDLVTKYIPSFPYPDITVRMLLNHRSGLQDYIHFAIKPADKLYLSNDDVVNLFATKKPKQKFPTNTKFNYSNSNFALLASIVESISGMKFDFFMKRYIFTPLKMNNTFVLDPNFERVCTAAFCYKSNWALDPDMHLDGVFGDKGVFSTVQDLYKWDQALYSNKFIKLSTLEEAYKPYSNDMPGNKNYGLGWRMINYEDGYKVVYHNGWWHGNNTCFYRFLQDNFTIIVLGNKFNKNIYRQPLQVYQIISGKSNDNMSKGLGVDE